MNDRFSSGSIIKHLLICLGTVSTLSGCGEIRRTLGLDTAPPDEFSVVEDQPLVVPPLIVPRDFELRAPQPGARRPQEKPMSEEARDALSGTSGKVFQEKSLQGAALFSKSEGEKKAPALVEEPQKEEKKEPSLDPLTASLVSFEDAGVEEGNANSPKIEEVEVSTPEKAPSHTERKSEEEKSEEIFQPLTGEKAFIQQVPQPSQDEDFDRQKLDKEIEESEKPKGFFENLFFWKKDDPKELVDPEKEKERLDFKKHQEWREKVLNASEEARSSAAVQRKKPVPQTCSEIYGSKVSQANKVFYNLPEAACEEPRAPSKEPFQTPEIVKEMTASSEPKSSETKPPVRLLTHRRVPGYYKALLEEETHPKKSLEKTHFVRKRKIKTKNQKSGMKKKDQKPIVLEKSDLEDPAILVEPQKEEKDQPLKQEQAEPVLIPHGASAPSVSAQEPMTPVSASVTGKEKPALSAEEVTPVLVDSEEKKKKEEEMKKEGEVSSAETSPLKGN